LRKQDGPLLLSFDIDAALGAYETAFKELGKADGE
jgi:hypothetical protein